MSNAKAGIECRAVDKVFREGGLAVEVLSGLNFRVEQ